MEKVKLKISLWIHIIVNNLVCLQNMFQFNNTKHVCLDFRPKNSHNCSKNFNGNVVFSSWQRCSVVGLFILTFVERSLVLSNFFK